MNILETSVYRGPNVYALFPVIRHKVDIGVLEDWPTGRLGEDFVDPLIAALPSLHEHGCSYGAPGGFIRRLREDEGTWFAHVWEHVAIEIQNIAGADVTFGKTRSADEAGVYNMVFEFEEERVGLEAADLALKFLTSLLPEDLVAPENRIEDFDFDSELESFIRSAQRLALGPSTASLVKAAKERDIPYMRLNNYSSLIQLGHGRYQKRIQATITSETNYISVELASDKDETNRILADLGLPVPRQRLVRSREDALRAAKRLGYPVVVKPLDGNHGRGISIELEEDEHILEAFDFAKEHSRSRSIIVETFIRGFDHRMLVVNDDLVAVSKRVPGHVIGDGKSTIAELVDVVNSDPRRGVGHEKVLTRLELDTKAMEHLEEKTYTPETVLEDGETLYLRSTANLSTGGTAIDVTDIVHPDNREMAVRAVKAIGLDIGGVDFLSPDISQSYKDNGAGICEINAAPGFRMHVAPSEGKPRDVAGAVMNMLFPENSPARIPMISITGTNGKTTTSRMVSHIFKMSGHTVGLATTDGVYINGNLTVKGDLTGPMSAQMVLRDPTVDLAVLETARGGIVRSGMGYRHCDIGAVLNISADHLGLKGVDTLEDMARVKRLVVEIARDTAVLNADDEHCLKMAEHTDARNICYVTMHATHPLVKEHIRVGGRAVVLEQGINGQMITLYEKSAHIPLMWTHLIPATMEGRAMHNVNNAMFAAAIAFSQGLRLEDIRHGLSSFATSFSQAPGRMNVFDEHPFKVILDYGHNPAAFEAMTNLVDQLNPTGRRIGVFAVPGDRRDEDIAETARIIAGHYDHYICKRDDTLRGRGPDEVPKLLKAGLLANGVSEADITIIPSEEEAVDAALNMAEAGDLLVIFGDDSTRCWKQIIYFNRPGGYDPENSPTDGSDQTASIGTYGSVDDEPGRDRDDDEDDQSIAVNLEGLKLVRDKRGVRLAVDPEDSD
ncbi:cyanophycin synthetase [Algimonas porphyrae]|uniref:Cyanophycin synthetase n=1 Tax=Algimonas porphyrae TaxID=1128113 RepID=A0ABQ5V1N3_9PROT|nr:cyanophycin synthetase [Algimonas porphyrae]GLQ21358.1 cyanophycin synthetase [Algimonas porphyrae]